MSEGDRLSRVMAELWPERSTLEAYAILDGARDERIVPAVTSSGLDHACLYAGKLPRELLDVAPYLVRLDRHRDASHELLERTWGQSAGIFVLTTASLEDLRRHFRRFLRVHDEQGQVLIFRYDDPRVMRVYLPTCNAAELRTVFGPVAMFLVEAEDASTLVRFHRQNEDLGRSDVTVGP